MPPEFQPSAPPNTSYAMWDEYRRILEGRREFTGSPLRPIENLALNYDIGGNPTEVSRYSTFGDDEFLGGETFGSVTGQPPTVKGVYTPSKDI